MNRSVCYYSHMLQRSNLALFFRSVLSILILSCIGTGCGDRSDALSGSNATASPNANGKITVLATTRMVADVVANVVGEHANVITLIPAGADPHLWTPTRSDILQLLEADALFMNGLGLEGRAGEAFSRVSNSGRPVCVITGGIPEKDLLQDPSNTAHPDPHVWMDPQLWGTTAHQVAEALATLDPAHAAEFKANATKYAAEANALVEAITADLANISPSNRVLVSSHDAFGYFGKRFNFEVRGIQGISTESEASVGDIERLVAEISERKIPTVFVETTVSDRTIRAVVDGCAARDHTIKIGDALYSDSMGAPGTPGGTWVGMIKHNARSIGNGLGGNS